MLYSLPFSSVQSLSHVQLCDPMDCSTRGLPVHHQLLEFTQTHDIESVMPINHLILCCPLLLLPSIFPSIRVFSNKSALHIRWPKYWSFSFTISPSNEHPGLISSRLDWLGLLAVHNPVAFGAFSMSIATTSLHFSLVLKIFQNVHPRKIPPNH